MAMKVKLITHTPNPEAVVATAARLCYTHSSVEDLMETYDAKTNSKFVAMLSTMGHESPLEHVSFTFAVEGVSRSLLAQLTRHRIASYSVQSQRYVRLDDFQFVVPPEIDSQPEAKTLFLEAMQEQAKAYMYLAKTLQEEHTRNLMAQGMDADTALKKAEKMANEDARFVLPNACETKILFTMNARSLKHFFSLRCCNRAQWEIRELAREILCIVFPIAPALFWNAGPNCVAFGRCTEGRMSCGEAEEMKRLYKSMKDAYTTMYAPESIMDQWKKELLEKFRERLKKYELRHRTEGPSDREDD